MTEIASSTTGSGLFADGPQPSAKSGRGRRQRAIGRHFIGKGRFADGQLSGHRQSFADGHISNRQRRHVSRRAVRLTAALPTADAARPSAKRFFRNFYGDGHGRRQTIFATAGHRQKMKKIVILTKISSCMYPVAQVILL